MLSDGKRMFIVQTGNSFFLIATLVVRSYYLPCLTCAYIFSRRYRAGKLSFICDSLIHFLKNKA